VAEDEQAQRERELLEQVKEELRKLKVQDLLLQTLYTLSSLGFHRMSSPDDKDLDQARLSIDALKALLPVLEGEVPADALRDFGQVVANMQLAYAAAIKDAEEPKSTNGQ
jgi:hypothetical protein